MKKFALVLSCVVSPFLSLQFDFSGKLDSKLELEMSWVFFLSLCFVLWVFCCGFSFPENEVGFCFPENEVEFLLLVQKQKMLILAFTVVEAHQRWLSIKVCYFLEIYHERLVFKIC